ncbi:IS1 family transposase [Armatimonas rosea]|uniref:IS1 family transposase n=1 Tax=Armatimonas rosea TaxID=685828 RepID=UPI003CCDCC19
MSKRKNLWLWTAVSRYSSQILGYVIGDRKWHWLGQLYEQLPDSYRKRLVYTDGYGAYQAFFSDWQHRIGYKFEGRTSVVEGVNNSLRHRCSFLVRRSSGPRDTAGMRKRVAFAVIAHNQACHKRWPARVKKSTQSEG